MGSQRAGHNLVTEQPQQHSTRCYANNFLLTLICRQMFSSRQFSCKESDMTEQPICSLSAALTGTILIPGEGNGNPLQYSCLENPMDGGACWAAVHGVTRSRTRLSNFTFTFHFHALEKEMATQSSVLAWRIPGTGEPGGLPSMGSHRVGHD